MAEFYLLFMLNSFSFMDYYLICHFGQISTHLAGGDKGHRDRWEGAAAA